MESATVTAACVTGDGVELLTGLLIGFLPRDGSWTKIPSANKKPPAEAGGLRVNTPHSPPRHS